MSDSKSEFVHPSIIQAINKQKALGQIDIKSLAVGDVITVETANSNYRLKLLEVSEKDNQVLLTSTNPKYLGPSKARLIGTTIAPGASTLNPCRFALGGQMELIFYVGDNEESVKHLTTSAVRRVLINGTQILPATEVNA